MKKMTAIAIIFLFVLAGCAVGPVAETTPNESTEAVSAAEATEVPEVTVTKNYDKFAKCLTVAGAKLYTTSWCPHCKKQKAMFGDSLKHLKLFECDTAGAKECEAKGVQGVPAWEFPNSKELVAGTKSLEEISKLGGCPLN